MSVDQTVRKETWDQIVATDTVELVNESKYGYQGKHRVRQTNMGKGYKKTSGNNPHGKCQCGPTMTQSQGYKYLFTMRNT